MRDGDAALGLERPVADEHLVQHHAQGPDVRSAGHLLAPDLFRAHVGDRPDGRTTLRQVDAGQLGDAEVQHLRDAVRRDQHVGGLDVPVDHPPLVSPAQPPGDLSGDVHGLRDRQRAPGDPVLDRLALVVGHRDEQPAVLRRSDLVDRTEIRVVQRGRGLRLHQESIAGGRIGPELHRQELQGDVPLEPGVLRPVDDTHATAADPVQHGVRAHPSPFADRRRIERVRGRWVRAAPGAGPRVPGTTRCGRPERPDQPDGDG